MARTAEDLILLDSIVRINGTTTANGLLDDPVSCRVNINREFNFSGVRIGLPSDFGWEYPGLSAEVGLFPRVDAISAAYVFSAGKSRANGRNDDGFNSSKWACRNCADPPLQGIYHQRL